MNTRLFISYTKEKNLFNAITLFRNHLQSELRRKSGEKNLTVFLDTDLSVGNKWDDKLMAELESSSCLIILISPLWLNSEYCLKEYYHFLQLDNSKRPIVPILWDEIIKPETLPPEKAELLNELNKIQKSDWTLLQYENWESPVQKIKLAELAKEIILLM